jgi:hypothetical protein
MKATKLAQEQSMIDISLQELDELYYPGYTEDLLESDPERLDWELKELRSQFSHIN